MLTFSTDPAVAERQMQAIIFYLTTFGYIDGDFDYTETKFIRDYIGRLVEHRVDTGLPNADAALAVVSVAAWCIKAELDESRVFGEAVAEAIAESGSKVALLASGSLSHRLWPNHLAEAGMFKMSSKFNELVDGMVLEMWRAGRIAEFLEMLPEYAQHCSGEAGMHDTAMLFGALGWDRYTGRGEVLSDYFPSSGTGQVNVMFTLPESSASVTPASAAGG